MSFGATDYFGFADTNWVVVGSSRTLGKSQAQSIKADGDINCETVYDTAYTYSNEYELVPDTGATDMSGHKLGKKVGANIMISGAKLSTSNTAKPRVSIDGVTSADSADGRLYTLDAFDTIALGWGAVAIGAIADTASSTNVTGSDLTASVQVAFVQNASGNRAADEVYQGRLEATNNLTCCTGTPTAVADTANGWVANADGLTTSNTDYASGSVGVFKNLAADT